MGRFCEEQEIGTCPGWFLRGMLKRKDANAKCKACLCSDWLWVTSGGRGASGNIKGFCFTRENTEGMRQLYVTP